MSEENERKFNRKAPCKEVLESLEIEDRLLDDHGTFIIGVRDEFPTELINDERANEEN